MKNIDTKKQRSIKHVNTIVAIIFITLILTFTVFCTKGSINNMQFQPDVRDSVEFRIFSLMVALFAFEVFLFAFFTPAAVFFAVQRGRGKGYKENTSYKPILEIDYYRDILSDITPATMSILADLKIESWKDISATLLRLYNKKIIAFEETHISITENNAEVSADEEELLEMLKHGGITYSGAARWKRNRQQDAFTDGYIRSNSDAAAKIARGCFFSGCLSVILFFLIFTVIYFVSISSFDDIISSFDRLDFYSTSILSLSDVVEFTYLVKYSIIFMLVLNIIMLVPCRWIFISIGYAISKKNLVRTEKGNELAEKIAGLQRFIHEFSNLSQAQKEQVVLWDDFLVYAVVLEENESIVKEISKAYKGVDISTLYQFQSAKKAN